MPETHGHLPTPAVRLNACPLTPALSHGEGENHRSPPGEARRVGSANGVRIANPRYSRLPVGATGRHPPQRGSLAQIMTAMAIGFSDGA